MDLNSTRGTQIFRRFFLENRHSKTQEHFECCSPSFRGNFLDLSPSIFISDDFYVVVTEIGQPNCSASN